MIEFLGSSGFRLRFLLFNVITAMESGSDFSILTGTWVIFVIPPTLKPTFIRYSPDVAFDGIPPAYHEGVRPPMVLSVSFGSVTSGAVGGEGLVGAAVGAGVRRLACASPVMVHILQCSSWMIPSQTSTGPPQ